MPNVPNFLPTVSSATALKAAGGALKKLKKLKIGFGKGRIRKPRSFKAPSGRKFTVLQRNDIDWKLKTRRPIKKGPPKVFATKTNLEWAKEGKIPKVKVNGKLEDVNLHHYKQNKNGPLIEILGSDHTNHDAALHPFKGKKSKIDRNEFRKDREAYWKLRANEQN